MHNSIEDIKGFGLDYVKETFTLKLKDAIQTNNYKNLKELLNLLNGLIELNIGPDIRDIKFDIDYLVSISSIDSSNNVSNYNSLILMLFLNQIGLVDDKTLTDFTNEMIGSSKDLFTYNNDSTYYSDLIKKFSFDCDLNSYFKRDKLSVNISELDLFQVEHIMSISDIVTNSKPIQANFFKYLLDKNNGDLSTISYVSNFTTTNNVIEVLQDLNASDKDIIELLALDSTNNNIFNDYTRMYDSRLTVDSFDYKKEKELLLNNLDQDFLVSLISNLVADKHKYLTTGQVDDLPTMLSLLDLQIDLINGTTIKDNHFTLPNLGLRLDEFKENHLYTTPFKYKETFIFDMIHSPHEIGSNNYQKIFNIIKEDYKSKDISKKVEFKLLSYMKENPDKNFLDTIRYLKANDLSDKEIKECKLIISDKLILELVNKLDISKKHEVEDLSNE